MLMHNDFSDSRIERRTYIGIQQLWRYNKCCMKNVRVLYLFIVQDQEEFRTLNITSEEESINFTKSSTDVSEGRR